MTKPFDNVARFIHSIDRNALPNLLNIRAKSIEACDTDVSTVSSQTELLLLIDKSYALHLEYVVNYKGSKPEAACWTTACSPESA